MRYSVRRLRRKLPKATIILCCWLKEADLGTLEQLREAAKADLIAKVSARRSNWQLRLQAWMWIGRRRSKTNCPQPRQLNGACEMPANRKRLIFASFRNIK